MEILHEEVILYEARKTFDLIGNSNEKINLKVKSYLYINLFLFTSFVTLFKLLEHNIDFFSLAISLIFFINFLLSFILILNILHFIEFQLNPYSEYLKSKEIYNEETFYDELIKSYEEANKNNLGIYNKREGVVNIIFYQIFITISLLIIITIIYLVRGGN